MAHDPATDWLKLARIPGIGPCMLAGLVESFGSVAAILKADDRALRAAGLSTEAISLLRDEMPAEVAAALEWAERPGNHLVTPDGPRYPPLLREIPLPPLVLYVMGDADLLAQPQLAIVGSRNPTPQGLANAREFARHFAEAGVIVTSGLALGIDGAAHEGALAAGGRTIAVIGTGADRVYPARHRDLARRIAESGALVTEFPLGTKAHPGNFPQRNRIISGLSFGVLVVEAAQASGSLITARLATEQGREVFAIPGSIHNPLTRGCHALIRQGAKLVETAADIVEELGWIGLEPPENANRSLSQSLRHSRGENLHPSPLPGEGSGERGERNDEKPDPDYAKLLDALGYDPATIDALVARSGLTVAAVSSMLLLMELDGRVATLPGGRYQRLVSNQR